MLQRAASGLPSLVLQSLVDVAADRPSDTGAIKSFITPRVGWKEKYWRISVRWCSGMSTAHSLTLGRQRIFGVFLEKAWILPTWQIITNSELYKNMHVYIYEHILRISGFKLLQSPFRILFYLLLSLEKKTCLLVFPNNKHLPWVLTGVCKNGHSN